MTTTVVNTKIREVKNKIPDVIDLVKKTDYKAEIPVIEANTFLLFLIILNYK